MGRVGVFVDAGYLCTEGVKAIAGVTMPMSRIRVEPEIMVRKLTSLATQLSAQGQLLRIYWYDGVRPTGMSGMQRALAYTDEVKMRLGLLTASGRQKGVDGLIVADLIELTRNRAITDALLVSGDEDVRIGVQLAQVYGVRVHLLGIGYGRGNQSNALIQEADTVQEWPADELKEFMSANVSSSDQSVEASERKRTVDGETTLKDAVREFADSCGRLELDAVARLKPEDNLPDKIDGRLLATCRDALGRYLNSKEKWYVRHRLKRMAQSIAQSDSPSP